MHPIMPRCLHNARSPESNARSPESEDATQNHTITAVNQHHATSSVIAARFHCINMRNFARSIHDFDPYSVPGQVLNLPIGNQTALSN